MRRRYNRGYRPVYPEENDKGQMRSLIMKDVSIPEKVLDEYLEQRIYSQEKLLKKKEIKETSPINSVSMSGDDKLIVYALEDRSIKLYNLETQELCHCFEDAHTDQLSSVAISNDSKFIVSGSLDTSVKVFQVETKELYHHFQDVQESPISLVAISSDSRYIVSVSNNRSIKTYDLRTKQLYYHFENAHEEEITSVAISSDSKYIVSGSKDKSIQVYNLETKQVYHRFEDAYTGQIRSVVISKDSKFIVAASYRKPVRMYNLETKELYEELYEELYQDKSFEEEASSLAISNDNKYIVIGTDDKSIRVYNLETKQLFHFFKSVHDDEISSIAISSDNKFVLSGSKDKSIKVFSLEAKPLHSQNYHLEKGRTGPISSVAISSDSKIIVSGGSNDKQVIVYNMDTKELSHFPDAHKGPISSVAISSDSKFVVSGSKDKSIKVYHLETKKLYHHFNNAHKDEIMSVAISSDSKYIASGSKDKSIKVYNLETKELHHHFEDVHKGPISSVAISSESKFIVSGSNDKSIKVYNMETMKLYHHFEDAHKGEINTVATSNDGKFIVSGSKDNSINVHHLETKKLYHHFENAHEDEVLSVAISSDSKFIVSGSNDKSIKVYNLETKELHHHFEEAHQGPISSVAISSDSKFIISGSHDKTIKIQTINFAYEIVYRNKSFSFFFTDLNFQELSNSDYAMSPFLIENRLFEPGYSCLDYVQALSNFPLFRIYPHNWTLLHLFALHQDHHIIIPIIPSYAELKIPIITDIYGKTPLHYLFDRKKLDITSMYKMLTYTLDYLEDPTSKNSPDREKTFRSLSSITSSIFTKANSKLLDRFLKLCVTDAPRIYGLPRFAQPKPNCAAIAPSQALEYNFSLEESDLDQMYQYGQDQVVFKINKLYLDYQLASDDMFTMVKNLIRLSNEELFRNLLISKLIDYLWNRAIFLLKASASLFLTLIILISVYIGLGDRNLTLEIIILCLTTAFLGGEALQIKVRKSKYFESLWELNDLSFLLLTFAFIIMRFTDTEDALAIQWVSTIIIMLGYLRLVSYLRIFKPTRNLIQIIVSIFKDMLGFIVIITLIIIGFSLMFLSFNRDDDYGTHLYGAYQVLYGNYDDSDYNISQKLIVSIILFLLNVLLLNLLISIMGDSYDKVQERRVLSDSLTRLNMILEIITYKRAFGLPKKGEKGFLMFCVLFEEEEVDDANEWEGRINVIKKLFKQTDQKIKEVTENMENMEKKIMTNMENRMGNMEKKMDEMMQAIKANSPKS